MRGSKLTGDILVKRITRITSSTAFSRLRFLRNLLAAGAASLVLCFVAPTAADPATGIVELTTRLRSDDFRVRVQAALLLGKTNDARAVAALKKSLSDSSVAVRAASAAALATLGDPVALPALRRAQIDDSAIVKRKIQSAIARLERRERDALSERRSATILVKLASIDSRVSANRAEAIGATAQASRRVLRNMTQVALLNPTEDANLAAKRHKRPAVLVQPSIRQLKTSKQGSETVASAQVEFLVQRMPEQAIIGKLTGEASASAVATTAGERAELVQDALGAAVKSALERSESTLLAAAGG